MRLLGYIQTVPVIEHYGGMVSFIADADIDCDGSGGNPDHDPYFQDDTTLHFKGKALNAYEVPYIVVPPLVVQKVKGIVMGCQAFVTNLSNGLYAPAVVGDRGPTSKIGELSVACAKAIGLPSNPNYGGTDLKLIGYEIWPGVPAKVGETTYTLQPS